jgi:hypothetical protein
MACRGRKTGMKWGAMALVCMAISLVSFSPANAELLFWADGGSNSKSAVPYDSAKSIATGTLYYIDSASPTVEHVFVTGAAFVSNDGNLKGHTIPSATFDWTSGAMTNFKVPYITYFKGGRIYLLNTTVSPPTATQVSSEAGLTVDKLCYMETAVNWVSPKDSAISYIMQGPGATACEQNDVHKVVSLSMTSTTAPITTNMYPGAILMDGRYAMADYSSGPPYQLRFCNNTLTTCTKIGSFTNGAGVYSMDSSRVIMNVDGSLCYFDYKTKNNTKKVLYTPLKGESVAGAKIDTDGNVYFGVVRTASPYTNYIKRVLIPASGNATAAVTLASFTTTSSLNSIDFQLALQYVVYSVPNGAVAGGLNNGAVVSSINKKTLVVKQLASASVNGGAIGSYLFFEDNSGNVNKIDLDGTSKSIVPNAQLLGVSLGGIGNWFYQFDPSGIANFRFIINDAGQLESYTTGMVSTALGTLPGNLSNPASFQISHNMLMTANRRDTNYSVERDVLFLNIDAKQYRRLTNDNGVKGIVQPEWNGN